MKITSHNNLNFKAITPSSKADIIKEIKALRKAGENHEATLSLAALKKLSSRATDYTIVYCRDVMILNSKNPNYKSKELLRGYFTDIKLSEFLGNASHYIEKQKLRNLKAAKTNSLFHRCLSKITKLFGHIK